MVGAMYFKFSASLVGTAELMLESCVRRWFPIDFARGGGRRGSIEIEPCKTRFIPRTKITPPPRVKVQEMADLLLLDVGLARQRRALLLRLRGRRRRRRQRVHALRVRVARLPLSNQ